MGAHCTHKELTLVLRIGGCRLWAGNYHQAKKAYRKMALVISLLGDGHRPKLPYRMSRDGGRILSHVRAHRQQRSAYLALDWPDMGVPDLDAEFWQALYADLQKLKGDAVVFCMGGHGRTGTTLAALASMSGACGKQDPVLWVREHYCEDAVETQSQLDYLEDELGIVTRAKPARLSLDSDYRGSWFDRKDRPIGYGQESVTEGDRIEVGGFDFTNKLRD